MMMIKTSRLKIPYGISTKLTWIAHSMMTSKTEDYCRLKKKLLKILTMNSSLGSERRIRSKKTGKAKDVVKKLIANNHVAFDTHSKMIENQSELH
jgi:hypothetical protein